MPSGRCRADCGAPGAWGEGGPEIDGRSAWPRSGSAAVPAPPPRPCCGHNFMPPDSSSAAPFGPDHAAAGVGGILLSEPQVWPDGGWAIQP